MSLERMVQSRFLRPVVTGILASILGCASPSGQKGLREACGSDGECAGQYVCDAQKCVGGSGASCGTDYDCSGKLNCEQGKCVAGSGGGSGTSADGYAGGKDSGNVPSGTPLQTQKTVGGVGITSGNTNSNGQVQFIDSGNKEMVTITVKDKNNSQAIGGAGVTFLDGNGFELFQVYKKGFVPSLGVYGHNSGHEITLVNENYNALTIFEYYHDKNPDEYYALDKYVQWAGNNYLYVRCATREELKKGDEWALKGLSILIPATKAGKALWHVISYVMDKLDTAEKLGLYEKYPDEMYHIYQAANFTGPQYLKGVSIGKEICNDGIDNDCDKYIDAKDSDCQTASKCTPHAITVCNNNNVQWKNSCGKLEEIMKTCSTSQTCSNSQCVDNKPSCTPQYSKTCSSGDVYWQDSCGKLGNKEEDCTIGQTCYNGTCGPTSGFLDLGDGTVKDKKTWNIWQKNTSQNLKGYDAEAYCNNLVLGGSSNWSLPTLSELKSIHWGYSKSWTYAKCAFPGEFSGDCGYYWSNEKCVGAFEGHEILDFYGTTTSNSQFCYNDESIRPARCIKK